MGLFGRNDKRRKGSCEHLVAIRAWLSRRADIPVSTDGQWRSRLVDRLEAAAGVTTSYAYGGVIKAVLLAMGRDEVREKWTKPR